MFFPKNLVKLKIVWLRTNPEHHLFWDRGSRLQLGFMKLLLWTTKWMAPVSFFNFGALHSAYKSFFLFIIIIIKERTMHTNRLLKQAFLEYYLNFQIEMVITCSWMKFWGSELSQRVSLHNGSYKRDVSLLGKLYSVARYVQNSLHESLFITNST